MNIARENHVIACKNFAGLLPEGCLMNSNTLASQDLIKVNPKKATKIVGARFRIIFLN